MPSSSGASRWSKPPVIESWCNRALIWRPLSSRTRAKIVPANLTRGARRASLACLEWGIRPPHYAIGSHAAADYERVRPSREIFVLYSLWPENGPPLAVSRRNDCSGKHRAITGVTLPPAPATVSCGLMAFNALLMCREEKHLRVLGKALDDVGMEQEVCLSAPEALDLTVQKHYSALV